MLLVRLLGIRSCASAIVPFKTVPFRVVLFEIVTFKVVPCSSCVRR
jgi:hypothetical protein